MKTVGVNRAPVRIRQSGRVGDSGRNTLKIKQTNKQMKSKQKELNEHPGTGSDPLFRLNRKGMLQDFHEPNPISRKNPPLGKVINFYCTCSLLPFHIFTDLIIGEVTGPPSPNCPFFANYITLPTKLGYQGSHCVADT